MLLACSSYSAYLLTSHVIVWCSLISVYLYFHSCSRCRVVLIDAHGLYFAAWIPYILTLVIAIGVIAESLSRSPFSVERPAPPGQWKCRLKCTISIAVAQRLRYIVSYGILSHSHSICIAFVLHCIALYGTTVYDKL